MDFLKLLPLIFRIIELAPKIKDALAAKTPILELLQKFAPDLISIVKSVGGELFPALPESGQVEVGALKTFDQATVRLIQDSLNKLGMSVPALVVDGDYGQKTKEAVTNFQMAHSLTVDGWAGKLTQAAIQTEVNKLTPAVGGV